ncbi:PepSY-associated TM helix domain-containing protein [Rossellomorea vietnamensis]|uniref:PepSY-associated TM helix domain-containing protein n=1 Tax=Rossellomorea vietnamensis TaxID=218284 RepID=UPI001E31A330|nr:PepSY domain-containing protein [Rossellomorea vietnamensis]MCC5800800.1 PepSY domain-containing protein [Rossellomorea vietnamensis]
MGSLAEKQFQETSAPSKKKSALLYRAVWRWHFYAGLIFSPFLIILAFSGAVYLFKPQIEDVMYKDLYYIKNDATQPTALSLQLDEVKEKYPEGVVTSIKQYEDPERTTEFGVMMGDKAQSVYVNPYTAKVQGSLDSDKKFTTLFKKLHSELIVGGTVANRLVELAACWAVILLLTGLYIWWPRNKASIWGTVLPRLRKKGRIFWRDLHAVPAFWLSLFVLILIATGLPWSGVLGPQIQKMAVTPPYAYSFVEKPESVTVTKDVAVDIPWANENLPVPSSTDAGYMPMTIDEVQKIAEDTDLAMPYTISMPADKAGVFTLSHIDHPKDLATIHLDQYSGAVLSDVRFNDFGIGAKLVEAGIALHEGRLFGITNQLIGLVVCLGLIGIVISSFIMWRKRKPSGKSGAPSKPADKRTSLIVLGIMLVMGILMPLVGISIIIMLILDQFVLTRIKPVQQWLH